MNKNKMLVKALSGTLCAAMLMTNITPVFAATIENQSTSNETDSKETEVLYNKSASYFVTIPKTIVLDSDKTSAYGVKVDGDIPSDQEVYVSPIDEITDKDGFNFYMKDQSIKNAKADVVADVTQSKFYWDFEDAANGYEETNNSISATDLSSGVWKGTFDFEINMHKIKNETGLTLSTDGDVTMGLDDSVQVNAYMDGETVTNDVTWTSNNSAISVENGLIQTSASAEVGDSAIITVIANNEIESVEEDNKIAPLGIMTAHADEEMTASFKVTIVDIELSSYDLYIEPGESATLNATILPLETKGTVNWTRTAISGLNLNKNGNSVEISVSSDMEVGKTYQVVASFGDFSKVCTIHVGEKETHNHNYKSEVTKEPTCTEEGEKTYTCVDGDDSYTETIPALGHDYVNGVCTRCGDEQTFEAGLYDESDNLIITYDELRTKYGVYSLDMDIPQNSGSATPKSSYTAHMLGYVLQNNPELQKCTKLVVPDDINKIGMLALHNATTLKEIVLPESITSINTYAFVYCTNLISINLPSHLTGIGKGAFSDCTSLETIKIPNSVTGLAEATFYRCKNLKNVYIPSSVVQMSTYQGVTNYAYSPFANCSYNLTIYTGQTTIPTKWGKYWNWYSDGGAAKYILNVTSDEFDKILNTKELNISNVESISQADYNKYVRTIEKVHIGSSVKTINENSFYLFSKLTNVTVEENSILTTIGDSAFSGCSSLINIQIPNTVITIGNRAFSSCSKLTRVILPDNITQIGEYAFSYDYKLTEVEYKNVVYTSVTELENALQSNGVTIGTNAFNNGTGLSK